MAARAVAQGGQRTGEASSPAATMRLNIDLRPRFSQPSGPPCMHSLRVSPKPAQAPRCHNPAQHSAAASSCNKQAAMHPPHLHVLLACEHQLVVHDVVGGEAQPKQRGGGVQVARDGGAAVDVLSLRRAAGMAGGRWQNRGGGAVRGGREWSTERGRSARGAGHGAAAAERRLPAHGAGVHGRQAMRALPAMHSPRGPGQPNAPLP